MARHPCAPVLVLCGAALALVACSPSEPPPPAPAAAPAPTPPAPSPGPAPALPGASAPAAASWSGRWTGPEGTYLQITPLPDGRYRIAVRNLDGERSFDGSAGEGGLPPRFERDGQAEQLRPTDGAGTGMKWLDGKRDCLVVRPGEGYCRD